MLKRDSANKFDQKVNQIRKSITNPLDLRQLLLYLITSISKQLQLDNISFLLADPDAEEYQLKESIKLNKSFLTIKNDSALVNYFLNKRDLLFLSKIKVHLFKLEKNSRKKRANLDLLKKLSANMEHLQAEIAVPFFYDNKLIGILCIGTKTNNHKFSKADISFITTISNEFSIMVYSAVEHNNLKIKEKEMASLYEVGKVISSLFDFKKTFDIIIRNASILLKSPKILLFLYDDFDAKFIIKKSLGFSDFQLDKIDESIRFKECTQILCDTTEGLLIKTRTENSYYDESILQDLGVESVLSIPWFDEDLKIVGELRAMRPSSQSPFTNRDLEIASNLANNITVALNNSKRYQKSEEHLLELSTVYNITRSLTSEFELEKIQEKVCSIFTDVLDFQRSILYLYTGDNQLTPITASGWDREIYKDIVLDISSTIEGKSLIEGRIFQASRKDLDNYSDSAIKKLELQDFVVLPLLIINKKPIGVLVIDTNSGTKSTGKLNLRLLTAIANQSAIIIENATLYNKSEELNQRLQKDQARTAKELQIARYIQQGLLSAKLPESKALHIHAINIPCRAVGGDFFNFIQYDENNLGVVIGDVSGKGIPAALLMTMTNSIFTEFGKRYISPEEVLRHANKSLQSYLSRSPIFYVTAFYCVINFEKNILRFCKAGHNPPILYRAKTDELIFLDSEGTYLGTFDDGGFIDKNIRFETGDKLVLYTDGLTEVRNEKKKMFSKERLAELVREHHTLPAEKLNKLLIDKVEKYGGTIDTKEFSDDITLVTIDYKELRKFTEKTVYKMNFKIKNKLEEVKKTISDILKKLEALEINKRIYNHIRLAISEALMNALEHGNKNDPKKNITIKGNITNRKIEVSITDQGDGFDQSELTYSENQGDINHRGRGITAIHACVDEIKYNDSGNGITLIKYMI